MKNLFAFLFASLTLCLPALNAMADEASDIQYLQTRWADIKYASLAAKNAQDLQKKELQEKDQQEKAFAELAQEADKLVAAHSSEAPYLIWAGIIHSTYAGAKGGLGALDEVKRAKKLFEKALALAPDAMMGSAYTSLGSLYYQVPGWPVGFGDNDKAKAMLLKGLSYNPDGIDSNYFYGDFLLDQKQYQQALMAFEKALQAPARAGRELADKGRKAEIATGIIEAKKHL